MGRVGGTGKIMKEVTVDYCEDVYICGYFNEAKISKYRFLSIVAVLQYRKKYQIFKLFETLSVHRQNVPRQNVQGTYMVPRTKRPRDKWSQGQNVPRTKSLKDKTVQGTKRPKGQNVRAGNSLIGFPSKSLVFCPKMSE